MSRDFPQKQVFQDNVVRLSNKREIERKKQFRNTHFLAKSDVSQTGIGDFLEIFEENFLS